MAGLGGGWRVWIDRGGTFTDVVARDPAGRLHVRKLLSEDPREPEDPAVRAVRDLLAGPGPGAGVEEVRVGTTVATNALLERRGARVGLLVTAGLEDALEVGTQDRPDLFALAIVRPAPLAARVHGVAERVLACGQVRAAPDLAAVRVVLEGWRRDGVEAVAVAFAHAYAHPAHEAAVAALARAAGFAHVVASHEVAREVKLVARGDTTVADAYLTPVLRRYVGRLEGQLARVCAAGEAGGPGPRLRVMTSAGGLALAHVVSGKDAVLSGPAGGVVACARIAEEADLAARGLRGVLGFDMGGTSTDVCRVDLGAPPELLFERRVAGVRLQAPTLDVHTIAAGGGSLLRFDGRRLAVGPESAGAVPGPVCYGRAGGLLAVTDANAALGRVQPAFFPRAFGPDGAGPLDADAARAALGALAAEVAAATGADLGADELAAGFVRIANDAMARAIRELSVARGLDPADYALCCFGGAGAQHACALADLLGVGTVLLHPLGGVLSAWGIGLAPVVHAAGRAVLRPLDEARADAGPDGLEATLAALEAEARAAVEAQGVPAARVEVQRGLDLRHAGTDAAVHVPVAPGEDPRPAFAARHRALFGFDRPGRPVEVVAARALARGHPEAVDVATWAAGAPGGAAPTPAARVSLGVDVVGPDGRRRVERRDAPVFARRDLPPGVAVEGPALIVEEVSTVVVDPGWRATRDARGLLVLARAGAGPRPARGAEGAGADAFAAAGRGGPGPTAGTGTGSAGDADAAAPLDGHAGPGGPPARPAERVRADGPPDPVVLEVLANRFMSIAEQMGRTLERVSLSVNMKERLDFSCALFDGEGRLVANAPHVPVHLGAMGESVRAIARARGDDVRPGDAYATNDPYQGGSHLPDVTVISPVFAGGRRRFWVACRGHHADVGGVAPGSMPPFSRRIDEEGVRLHDVLLVREGAMRADEVRALFTAGPWPVRGPEERLADLEAQVAANACGVRLLEGLCAELGAEAVAAYMGHVLDDAEAAMREAIAGLPRGTRTFEDWLDDGARIRLTLEVAGDRARLDFTGTDARLPGNLNAPRAVVLACVLYAFRTLVGRPVPLNEGCLRPLEVVVPPGSLLAPEPPDAVVGGNVETSQRLVDVLLGALGVAAASQGTMNNVTFGDATFGYYETIGGGAGAGPGFDGASGVHTHMTNTRITDVEVLERRCPVVVTRFGLRRGSGGRGVWSGGDGLVRALEARAPLEAAVLSERRACGPWGAGGAAGGAPGRNRLVRADGATRDLPGKVRLTLAPGDTLVVETPGGGGWSPTPAAWAAMDPGAARALFRAGRWRGPTAGVAVDRVQANLVVVPAALADAFDAYCRANPGPCPLLERLAPGDPIVRALAPGADLRRDLPRYRLHRRGPAGAVVHEDVDDLAAAWRPDDVAFLLGCSFTLEAALAAADVPVRHVEERRNVPMYRTTRATVAAGPFAGPLVVSMRPMPPERVEAARAASAPFPCAHGAPVHAGDPAALGIADLARPDWGDSVTVRPGEVPVFWACGVTSQEAVWHALAAGALDRALTHAPGHMFVADALREAWRDRPPG